MAVVQATTATASTARSVTFQGLDSDESDITEQEPNPERSHQTHPTRFSQRFTQRFSERFRHSVLSGRSLWRFPTTAGHMPKYMQGAFRMKTFGLMGAQLILVLALSVAIDYLTLWDHLRPNLGETFSQVIFYFIGAMNLTCILALQTFKDRYPFNYLLLALTTVMSGAFWGLTRGVTDFTLHFQILAILAFTMCSAAVISYYLTNLDTKITASRILVASLMPAWLVASVIDAILSEMIFHLKVMEVAGSIGFSLLLICILLVDVGKLLVRCRPDDFMSVIVAMNSTLMVVVSIPFFVLTFCFLHSGEALTEHVASEQQPRITDLPVPTGLTDLSTGTAPAAVHVPSIAVRSAEDRWPEAGMMKGGWWMGTGPLIQIHLCIQHLAMVQHVSMSVAPNAVLARDSRDVFQRLI